ncbi:Hypothetical_protein [Hexamita inflata]|uniref:Hypothetical_protein n=1 Tax=Hexamita inflata TaxID=28002 RepID=A0AA86R0Y7_9EUKA|nr:Hypothetical protein HINF_LOCUS51413 [Hexamita inflata]
MVFQQKWIKWITKVITNRTKWLANKTKLDISQIIFGNQQFIRQLYCSICETRTQNILVRPFTGLPYNSDTMIKILDKLQPNQSQSNLNFINHHYLIKYDNPNLETLPIQMKMGLRQDYFTLQSKNMSSYVIYNNQQKLYGKISRKDSWIHSRIEPNKIVYKLSFSKVYM